MIRSAPMAVTGLEVLDKSVQTTNIWLNEISEKIGPDRRLAWHVLGVVLRVLRDRLTAEEAAHLAAQLPLVVRGAYYDQYRPSARPDVFRSRAEFVRRVASGLADVRPVDPQRAVETVFAVLDRHIDAGETAEIRHSLPEEIRALFPSDAESRAQAPQEENR
jgi:uncharacterized protein (DUF2267 family)